MIDLIEAKDFNSLKFYVMVRISIVMLCWIFMIISSAIDLYTGVSAAKAKGEKITSKGFKRTVRKILDYAAFLLFFLMCDVLGSFLPFYKLPFISIIGTIAVLCIEGKSVIENIRVKKSEIADIPLIIKQIIKASTVKDGLSILEKLNDLSNKSNTKKCEG